MAEGDTETLIKTQRLQVANARPDDSGHGLARLPQWERAWLGAASILVISPSRIATLIGLAMGVPVLMRQIAAWRAMRVVVPVKAG